jgi:CheY-like chemotaxis protein
MAVVLVVDDEPPIVELIADLVEDQGHSAITAFNGVEALELARSHRPALIISDVMMPVMDGFALLQALRADPALAHTAVYLMSAASFLPPAGVAPDGFFRKPFDLGALDGLLVDTAAGEKARASE